jgi:hypothetical protein
LLSDKKLEEFQDDNNKKLLEDKVDNVNIYKKAISRNQVNF